MWTQTWGSFSAWIWDLSVFWNHWHHDEILKQIRKLFVLCVRMCVHVWWLWMEKWQIKEDIATLRSWISLGMMWFRESTLYQGWSIRENTLINDPRLCKGRQEASAAHGLFNQSVIDVETFFVVVFPVSLLCQSKPSHFLKLRMMIRLNAKYFIFLIREGMLHSSQ